MRNELESIVPILDARPDLATEQQDRTFMRDRVEAYFRSHPGQILTQEELEQAGGGDAVRTRVSECKLKLKMRIISHATFLTDAAGKKHRLRTRYQFLPHEPLGRDAAEVIDQKTLFELV